MHAPTPQFALEAELGCSDVLMPDASTRGTVKGLTAEVVDDDLRKTVSMQRSGTRQGRCRADRCLARDTYLLGRVAIAINDDPRSRDPAAMM